MGTGNAKRPETAAPPAVDVHVAVNVGGRAGANVAVALAAAPPASAVAVAENVGGVEVAVAAAAAPPASAAAVAE